VVDDLQKKLNLRNRRPPGPTVIGLPEACLDEKGQTRAPGRHCPGTFWVAQTSPAVANTTQLYRSDQLMVIQIKIWGRGIAFAKSGGGIAFQSMMGIQSGKNTLWRRKNET
jgi:hypothetical protein